MNASRVITASTTLLLAAGCLTVALAQTPLPAPAPAVAPAAAPQPPTPPAKPAAAARATMRPEVADELQPPAPPAAPRAPQAPTPPASKNRQLINVRVEFTITDQVGTKPPTRKTMTMTVADGEFSRIRTNSEYYGKSLTGPIVRQAPLSVDVNPSVEGNKIRLDFTLEYNVLGELPTDGTPETRTTVSERLAAVLDSGVPLVIAQSSDAMSDRKLTVEVKATIVK
jgi:hypothetical protein